MIVNAPSVAAGFLSLVQAGLAVSVCIRSGQALRALRLARTDEEKDAAEISTLRPALQAMVLVVVLLVSWSLLIEVLSSYVPIWPTVMCIEGVTKVGEGSVSSARHLPWLLDLLFVTKPVLVLLGTAWCAAHAVQRRGERRPGRLGPALLLGLGALAVVDSVVTGAYVLIPKKIDLPATGCCSVTTAIFADPDRSWVEHLAGGILRSSLVPWMIGAWTVAVAATAAIASRRDAETPSHGGLFAAMLAGWAATSIAAQHVVVAEISPRLTGISSHRCGWCVVEQEPLRSLAGTLVAMATGVALVTALAALRERGVGSAGGHVSRSLARLALGLGVAAAACAAAASL